jgi:hypothetical protein
MLNDLMIMFMSMSLIFLALKLLTNHNWDLKFDSENKFIFYKCTHNGE